MIKTRQLKLGVNMWAILSVIFIILLALPNLNILLNIFDAPTDNWLHIQEFLLREYVSNTFIIVIFTWLIATFLGTTLAWIVSIYDFPLRSFFKWSLVLPLAIPPYIAAYTYAGLLGYTGLLQTTFRNSFNINIDQKYTDIMSIQGAILIFSMFLFPYVYTITKAFIGKQSASLIETSRVLGKSPTQIFLSVVLPLSRAAIIGGSVLVTLEVISDYGVVQYFGIPTFSTAIFRAWFGLGDVNTAIKLSGILMLIVFAVLILEKVLRGGRRYSYTTTKVRPVTRIRLSGWKAGLAFIYSFTVFCLGFLIPTLQLMYWAFLTYREVLSGEFRQLIWNSVISALVAAVLIIVISLIIANFSRISRGWSGKFLARITIIGYSIPGAVIAIGVIVSFIALDNQLYWLYKALNEDSAKLVLSGSILMLISAYIIRFIGIGFNSIEAGFEKVGKQFFEASRTLGMTITQTFFKVDLKMISPAILGGFTLVFVDIMKELPLTLILRPFNFDTLATKAYQYASDELIQKAALPSLSIILLSFVSVYVFHKLADKEES